MAHMIWVKRKAKGQLAHWATVGTHPEYRIQAVDGQPLADYLYSLSWFDSSFQSLSWKHIGTCSDLELAKSEAEKHSTNPPEMTK